MRAYLLHYRCGELAEFEKMAQEFSKERPVKTIASKIQKILLRLSKLFKNPIDDALLLKLH